MKISKHSLNYTFSTSDIPNKGDFVLLHLRSKSYVIPMQIPTKSHFK